MVANSSVFSLSQFSLAKVLFIVCIYAIASALLAFYGLSLIQCAMAFTVLSSFVVIDLWLVDLRQGLCGKVRQMMIAVAYYSTSFAFATMACLLGFLLATPPIPSAPPSTSPLGTVIYPLLYILAILLSYIVVCAAFSFVASIASFLTFRHSRIARWLLFINCPGAVLFALFIIALCFADITTVREQN